MTTKAQELAERLTDGLLSRYGFTLGEMPRERLLGTVNHLLTPHLEAQEREIERLRKVEDAAKSDDGCMGDGYRLVQENGRLTRERDEARAKLAETQRALEQEKEAVRSVQHVAVQIGAQLAEAEKALRALVADRAYQKLHGAPHFTSAPTEYEWKRESAQKAWALADAVLAPKPATSEPKPADPFLGLGDTPICFCMVCKHQPTFGACIDCRCGNWRATSETGER